MKPRAFLVIVVMVLASNCAGAQSFLKKGMPFSHARKLLQNNLWAPVPMHSKEQLSEVGTQEEILIKNGIPEVDICSMDAGALCNLYYKKEQGCLTLTTRGETIAFMRVVAWKNTSCSDVLINQRQ